MARDVVIFQKTTQRHQAQVIAGAIIAAAKALPADRLYNQNEAAPRGILINEGQWQVAGQSLVLTAVGGDNRGALLLPGNARSDGTLALSLVTPVGFPEWTTDLFFRAEDLNNGYALRLRNYSAELIALNQSSKRTLAGAPLSQPPAAIRLSMNGTNIRAEIDSTVLTATDAAFTKGWLGLTSNTPAGIYNVSWADGSGTTNWSFAGLSELPEEWANLSTAALPNAKTRLTIRDAAAGTSSIKELIAAVQWNQETAEERTWVFR